MENLRAGRVGNELVGVRRCVSILWQRRRAVYRDHGDLFLNTGLYLYDGNAWRENHTTVETYLRGSAVGVVCSIFNVVCDFILFASLSHI